MKHTSNIYLILSFVILFLDTIAAKEEKSNIVDTTKEESTSTSNEINDKYYMLYINNTISDVQDNVQENVDRVDSIISKIHNLIIKNKDTYKDSEKFEQIEQQRKINKTKFRYLIDYGESEYVYPISTRISGESDTTLLYAYLSEKLVKTIKALPYVISCDTNHEFEYFTSSTSPLYYDEQDIQQETSWENVEVRENSDLHLSILSQGKYDDKKINKYDTNYYYPSSAGKDIDIFIFDSGFNFRHEEFSNTDERDAKCILMISGGRVMQPYNEDYCHGQQLDDHGSGVADNAAGLKHGVANKANVYGIYLNELDEVNYIAGLEYISKYLFKPYRAVFNFSFGGYYSIDDLNEFIYKEQSIINYLASQGGIFVAAAGNENKSVYSEKDNRIVFPCSFNHVICVGGIENIDKSDPFTTLMNSSNYKKATLSNFGTFVSLYAPFYTHVAFQDSNLQDVEYLASGTSYSSSLVAGIVATIMSENRDVKFTTYSMLYYLTNISSNNTITGVPEGYPNILINNGKYSVYSMDNIYKN